MFGNLHKISLISIEKAAVTQPNIYSLGAYNRASIPEKPVLQKFTVCRQNLYVKCLQCGGVMYQGRASIEYTIGRQFLGTTYRPLFLSIEAN